MKIAVVAAALIAAAVPLAAPAAARSLDAIRESGTLRQCAHPNALPFASRHAATQGFQIELGEAIAKQLGVALEPVWIIGPSQFGRAGCDIVTDAIADTEAQGESGLQISKPYYRTGVVLAVRDDSPVTSVAAFDRQAKIGVMVGSVAAMTLRQAGFITSTFGFEDEMLQALADKEIDAAAVSRAGAGYFTATHPGKPIHLVDIDSLASGLSWNVAVGMVKPDPKLRDAIDATLAQLGADGTIQRIYARYGVTLQAPK